MGLSGWPQGSAGTSAAGCHCPSRLVPTVPVRKALTPFRPQSVHDLRPLQACSRGARRSTVPSEEDGGMRARPLGGSPAPSHGLGVMPLSSAACRAGGGRGLPASLQTAWRSAAPRWQGPSAAVCSSGMPGAFQTPEGTAKPSPPAPAAHAEHAGGRPGSLSGPCSKPYDRQTDRQISVGSGLALPVPPLTSAGLLPSRPGCRQPARTEPSRLPLALAP